VVEERASALYAKNERVLVLHACTSVLVSFKEKRRRLSRLSRRVVKGTHN
jgi:hypothetical protein